MSDDLDAWRQELAESFPGMERAVAGMDGPDDGELIDRGQDDPWPEDWRQQVRLGVLPGQLSYALGEDEDPYPDAVDTASTLSSSPAPSAWRMPKRIQQVASGLQGEERSSDPNASGAAANGSTTYDPNYKPLSACNYEPVVYSYKEIALFLIIILSMVITFFGLFAIGVVLEVFPR